MNGHVIEIDQYLSHQMAPPLFMLELICHLANQYRTSVNPASSSMASDRVLVISDIPYIYTKNNVSINIIS
jgi:hypothetical protein